MHGMEQVYGHRHKWPFWNDQSKDTVIPRLARAAVDWQAAHLQVALNGEAEVARRRQAMLDLGVAAWWALNQYSEELFQPEQLALAGQAEERDESEQWESDRRPLDAWSAVIARRLSVIFAMVATGFGDPEEEAVMVRRQLLFIAFQTELALAQA